METLLHIAERSTRTTAERKAAEQKAEREADAATLKRIKNRKPVDPSKLIKHEDLKKSLGL